MYHTNSRWCALRWLHNMKCQDSTPFNPQNQFPNFSMPPCLALADSPRPRGWWNVEKRPTLTIFFSWIWLGSGRPPLAKYSMFSKFQCFFSMFFHHKDLIFLDSCTDTLYPFDYKLIRSKSCLKVFCAQIFTRRNICGKITQSDEFCDIHCNLLVPLSTTVNSQHSNYSNSNTP